jgi:signal transduction histidine kinase
MNDKNNSKEQSPVDSVDLQKEVSKFIHAVRSPLTGALGGFELAMQHLYKWERRDALDALDQTLIAINQIIELVNQLDEIRKSIKK